MSHIVFIGVDLLKYIIGCNSVCGHPMLLMAHVGTVRFQIYHVLAVAAKHFPQLFALHSVEDVISVQK